MLVYGEQITRPKVLFFSAKHRVHLVQKVIVAQKNMNSSLPRALPWAIFLKAFSLIAR